MNFKINKKPDEIFYYGNGIRIESEVGGKELYIWDTSRGQMPSYGRLDLKIKEAKELAEVLGEFIKKIED